MGERIHYKEVSEGAYHAMFELEKYLHECGLEEPLLNLIKLRASQINEFQRKRIGGSNGGSGKGGSL